MDRWRPNTHLKSNHAMAILTVLSLCRHRQPTDAKWQTWRGNAKRWSALAASSVLHLIPVMSSFQAAFLILRPGWHPLPATKTDALPQTERRGRERWRERERRGERARKSGHIPVPRCNFWCLVCMSQTETFCLKTFLQSEPRRPLALQF